MATVINNPDTVHHTDRVERHVVERSEGGGMGFLIGLLAIVILAVLFFVYALPALRNTGTRGGTNINVPDRINIDVNRPR